MSAINKLISQLLLLFWFLIREVLMHILVFLCPERGWVLLYEAVDIFVGSVLNFPIFSTTYRAEFLSEKINHTSGFSNFKSSILVIVHTVPGVLSSDCQGLSTINVDDLTSYFSGMLRSQMNNSMADLFNVSGSSHRICVSLFFHYWIIFKFSKPSLSVKICVQKGWGNAVNSNTESWKLKCRWFRHHLKSCFWHAIWNESGLWLWSLHARNINNTTLRGNNHILEKVEKNVWSSHVNIHQIVMILWECVVKVSSENYSGCVDKNIQLWLVLLLFFGLIISAHTLSCI